MRINLSSSAMQQVQGSCLTRRPSQHHPFDPLSGDNLRIAPFTHKVMSSGLPVDEALSRVLFSSEESELNEGFISTSYQIFTNLIDVSSFTLSDISNGDGVMNDATCDVSLKHPS